MKKIAKRSRDKRIDQRGPSCVPSFVQNSESNKASYRSKGKKKKSGWTDGTRKGFDDQNVVANCYFIPWTVSTSNSTRSTFRRGLRRRILPPPPPPSHRENAVQPMNDWELERGIRFALQEIPDNFARLSDERPLFAILLLVKMFHENDRTAARSVFVVQKESGRGL